MLAMHTGVAVLPIAHYGTRSILRSFRTWFPKVYVKIGKPYIPILPSGVSRKVGLHVITEDLMTRIAEMLPEEQRGLYGKIDHPNA